MYKVERCQLDKVSLISMYSVGTGMKQIDQVCGLFCEGVHSATIGGCGEVERLQV